MVGHLVNGQLDPDAPASLSEPTATGLLREELGWNGVVITDDLQATAITSAFGTNEAIARAIEAGNDLLCSPTNRSMTPTSSVMSSRSS